MPKAFTDCLFTLLSEIRDILELREKGCFCYKALDIGNPRASLVAIWEMDWFLIPLYQPGVGQLEAGTQPWGAGRYPSLLAHESSYCVGGQLPLGTDVFDASSAGPQPP